MAAIERLLERGASYAELTVAEIASEAGISWTSFYFAFEDKRDLLKTAAGELAGLMTGPVEQWLSDSGSTRDELERALRVLVCGFADHAPLLRAVIEAAAYDAQVGVFWHDLVARYIVLARDRLRVSGACTAERAEALGAAAVWMTERVLYQEVACRSGHSDTSYVVEVLADVWWGVVTGRFGANERA
ncbi:MAG: TetR/AcrR family transcriptional regulator [Solirubrobacteraceae bacterium]|nr:TetR/AcrR family transcriptional regulator [Solirubrobacteraceae bacterium]